MRQSCGRQTHGDASAKPCLAVRCFETPKYKEIKAEVCETVPFIVLSLLVPLPRPSVRPFSYSPFS
jgi:hypothetical protein